MHKLARAWVLAALLFGSLPASADLFVFSYTFDGIVPFGTGTTGQPGTVITGIVNGTLQSDGDTIAVNSLEAATLSGFAYDISPNAGVRGHVPGSQASISLSGDTLDIWVCVQGFTQTSPNGGDCSFGQEGGFSINNVAGDLALLNFPGQSGIPGLEQTLAWAGIPELDDLYQRRWREGDIPLNPANWSAALIDGDNDGVSDDIDVCPVTNLDATVSIQGIDSGVENIVFGETGCSIADLVDEVVSDCLNSNSDRQFRRCTARGFNSLRDAGVITGREKGALQSAAAQSVGGKSEKSAKSEKSEKSRKSDKSEKSRKSSKND